MSKDKFLKPMKASDFVPEKLKWPLLASPKFDGIRAVVDTFGSGKPQLISNSGKPIRNKFAQDVIPSLATLGFDGELIVGDPAAPDVYHRTSSGIMSADGEPDFKYHVFDYRITPDMDYNRRYEDLLDLLHNMAAHGQLARIELVRQQIITNMAELEALEQQYLTAGYEGMMIRFPYTPYKYGRSTVREGALLKVKRFAQDEAVIVGFDEMMTNLNEATISETGRTKRSSAKDGLVPADTLGAFVCRNKFLCETEFNVSPGVLTQAERKELWDNRDSYMGRRITFKHFAYGAKDKPRHSRFNGFREEDDA